MKTTLVLVDDDHGFRGRARLLLQDGGFDVIGEAGDAAAARAIVARLHPHAVLVDVGLPDVDGLTLAGQLRSDGATVVVAISGRDPSDFGPRVQHSGALGFISKLDLTAGAVRALLDTGGPG